MVLECILMITSPSGRQFESCKDISMYLLSIIGEENLDKPSYTRINDCNDPAMNEASGNVSWYSQLVL